MNSDQLLSLYSRLNPVRDLISYVSESQPGSLSLKGVSGSAAAILAASSVRAVEKSFLFILSDKESAVYFFNDLENLLGEKDHSYENRKIFLFPSAYRKPYEYQETSNANVLLRAEVVNRLATEKSATIVVSYPTAISEKVVSHKQLSKNMFSIHHGETLDIDFFLDMLLEYGFEQADFVVEPGTFCIRGGIMDVFSFSNDFPYRIEIMGNTVESLRSFNPETQLSVKVEEKISILPDIEKMTQTHNEREWLLESMPPDTMVWIDDLGLASAIVQESFDRAKQVYETLHKDIKHTKPADMFLDAGTFTKKLQQTRLIEFKRAKPSDNSGKSILFNCKPQPSFNKNFELFFKTVENNTRAGIRNYIISENPKQIDRIQAIFETIVPAEDQQERFMLKSIVLGLHEGFIDTDNKIAVFTDHQIFERYHRFRLRDKFPGKQALNIKELSNLKPGDYVTHIDHGIGIFSGLEKIEVNGKIQEAIRLIYKDEDILYISIHSLHRISKYSGKEGSIPSLHRLGSNAWNNLKNKTKNKVKDIAKDLIKLYAQRRAKEGFSFSADTYLQNELEASFIFEDTPDQETSTIAVKKDMEASYPMDRLICGDVGFGKTEIAIRAAFKAVTDSKQVAVLVPTTILALQHFYTFTERLRDFPCTIDYVSRFRSAKDQKEVFKKLASGQLDILIGTHKLVNKDIKFKDLGLLIIDEEQKFGVSTKEKLKQMKVNVDTLTLTATPIPRTLQFSLMGARDLSLINTPPPNRYPIITELHVFDEALIRDAIMYEVSRGGQVFFVHNRVQNIAELAGVVQRLCPDLRVAIGHGQLEGSTLEKIMVDFIQGEYDVLVSTTIIESGLDIPNANTIIINNAHHFGLSDLHQMRGRVGRTNKKAFCYLITPPASTLTDDARKRLRAIEEFSDLGSGFNIAMRDLDIRGAGNLLGAEQSGFISDIGYEMYQKILNEAMEELREKEFKDLYADKTDQKYQVNDCQLETDLELMIPSDYVSHIQERLNLYKELDNVDTDKQLAAFSQQLKDRFGPLPEQVEGLMKAVNVRWIARKIGFEKLILKRGMCIGYFPANQESAYFQGESFGRVLAYAQNNPRKCQLRETSGRLSLSIERVRDINQTLEIMHDILETE